MTGIILPLWGLRIFLLRQGIVTKHGRPERAGLVKQVTSECDMISRKQRHDTALNAQRLLPATTD